MNGSYIESLKTTYLRGDFLTFKCDFGPDNYIGSIECGENDWIQKPHCPVKETGYNVVRNIDIFWNYLCTYVYLYIYKEAK